MTTLIRLFQKRKVAPDDLLTSRLFNERGFYPAFLRDLAQCSNEVIIESPYITLKRIDVLLPMFDRLRARGVAIKINTRHPKDHGEVLRIQAWIAIKKLRQIGIKVRFFTNYHHRKIAVLDGRVLWEGSLNILSQNYSCEIMRRIESQELAAEMVRFLGIKKIWW